MEPKKYACACVWPWVCMVSRGCYVAWKENGLILCSALVVVVMYGKVMKFMKVVVGIAEYGWCCVTRNELMLLGVLGVVVVSSIMKMRV